MVTIFTTSRSSLDPDLAPILVSCVQQALAMVSTGVLRVCPRKPLFLVCASLMAAAQFGHATYYYLVQPEENENNNYGSVPTLPESAGLAQLSTCLARPSSIHGSFKTSHS